MIIVHPDFVSVAVFPSKQHTPLIVYPYAIKTSQVPFEGLKSVTRRYLQVGQGCCCVNHVQLPESHSPNFWWKSPAFARQIEPFCLFVPKALYHNLTLTGTVVANQAKMKPQKIRFPLPCRGHPHPNPLPSRERE